MNKAQLAAPELAQVEIEADEMDRKSLIVKGALAAGAVYGAVAVGPYLRRAIAQGGASEGDLAILNFALTLEYLEAAFYEQALSDLKPSGELGDLVELISSDENEHVDALTASITDLGGKPVKAPGVDFGEAFASEDSFLELAQTFEDTGVSAYNGAAPDIESKDILATAGGIVQIEARHAAAIRLQRGELPSPAAFDETLTQDEVLKAVMPFITSS
ncbi:MAG: ferritin-like domain-containing protein [Solirubrobacterales bacterium]